MALWQTLLDKLNQPAEPTPRQVVAAHVRELVERHVERAPAGPLRVLDERGEERVAVETALRRVEVFCHGPREVSVRIGSGVFLDAEEGPDEVKRRRKHLTELGLTREHASKDFALVVEGELPRLAESAALRAFQIFERLLAQPADAAYSVSIERSPRLDSSELLDSIRQLASKRDLESRRIVYQHVINSHWLLPFKATPDVLALAEVDAWHEPLGGLPVWAVYSDHEALLDARGADLPYEVVSGITLVKAAVRRGLGALKINPASKVGGELYGNELQSLSNYLSKLGI